MHHLLSIIQASLKAAWLCARHLSPTLEGEKLGYLRVSYRILERNFYESAQSNGVEQYSEQSSKPSSQQWILKKSRKAYISSLHREWLAVEFTQAFLAGYTSLHERYHIDIYTQRTTKLFTPIIKSFVALKVLIQNKRTRWFMARTLRSAFVQGTVRVGYSPLFFYYELLILV